MQTFQPSEPILAHIASNEMTTTPAIRERVIEALYGNVIQGTIHLGDIGEMVACLIFCSPLTKQLNQASQDQRNSPRSLNA